MHNVTGWKNRLRDDQALKKGLGPLSVLLKLQCARESLRSPLSADSDSVGLGWSQKFFISSKFSGDAIGDSLPIILCTARV